MGRLHAVHVTGWRLSLFKIARHPHRHKDPNITQSACLPGILGRLCYSKHLIGTVIKTFSEPGSRGGGETSILMVGNPVFSQLPLLVNYCCSWLVLLCPSVIRSGVFPAPWDSPWLPEPRMINSAQCTGPRPVPPPTWTCFPRASSLKKT